MLFYTACREPVFLKKGVIDLHIKSTKHTNSKEKADLKEKKERDKAEMFKAYDNPVGENLSNLVHLLQLSSRYSE